MATQKEIEMVNAIVTASFVANEKRKDLDFSVEICTHSIRVHVSEKPRFKWAFYPEDTAYFSDDVWEESRFIEVSSGYLRAINALAEGLSIDTDEIPQ